MFWSFVQRVVELLGEGAEEHAELLKSQPIPLPGVEVDQVVVLHAGVPREVRDGLGTHVALVVVVDHLEQVDQVEVIHLRELLPQLLQSLLLNHNLLEYLYDVGAVDILALPFVS